MEWFKNLNIKTKLFISFSAVAIITTIIGYQGITKLKALDDSDTFLYEKNTVPLDIMGRLSTAFQRQRVNLLLAIIAEDESTKNSELTKVEERDKELEVVFDEYVKTFIDENDKRSFETLVEFDHEYDKIRTKVIELVKSNNIEEARNIYTGEMEPVRDKVQTQIANLMKLNKEAAV